MNNLYTIDYEVWVVDYDNRDQAVSMSCYARFRYFQESLDYTSYVVKSGHCAVVRNRRPDGTIYASDSYWKKAQRGEFHGSDHTGYRPDRAKMVFGA